MKQFYTINKYSLVILFLFISFSSLAQNGGNGAPPPPGNTPGGGGVNDQVPINMYWFILLATGAYYGVKKLR